MTPSEGVDKQRDANWEMLESLLGLGGLVLLRGEGRRHRGFGAGLKRGKWKGKAIGHSLGVEVATGS